MEWQKGKDVNNINSNKLLKNYFVKKKHLTKYISSCRITNCKGKLLYKDGECMEEIVKKALLYDFYGQLLTEHQRALYEDIVLNDLSYAEIAKEEGISRQGVYDLIKRCDKILSEYEEKLHLVEKFLNTKKKVTQINQFAKDIKNRNGDETLQEQIEQIEKISNAILEEY